MQGRTLIFVLLPLSFAAAQFNTMETVQNVRIHIALPDGTCDPNAAVTLSGSNEPLVHGTWNNHCEVEFLNVPKGEYRVDISGERFTNADLNNTIYVSSNGPIDFEIQMQQRKARDFNGLGTSAFVSAADLAVPNRARKELDKSNELIRHHELQQAVEKLKKAIRIYPQYALAYNNLGVLYSQLNDRAQENEALQKAISLNPRFSLAYVNLGRMNMKRSDYRAAEEDFNKALSVNANDAVTLILLAYSEFMDKSFEASIATSRQAHALDTPHAFAHRVAARAFEEQKQGGNAIAELEMFLKEEPSSPRAVDARHEIEIVRTALPN